MSYAYLSNALPDMVMSTDEKLRQERANLWRAKYLSRQLIGDAIWIPAGEVETPNDWELFEPSKQSARGQPSRKRKRKGEEHHHENSNGDLPSEAGPALNGTGKGNVNPVQDEDLAQMNGPEAANVTAGSEAATDPQIAKSDGGDDRQTDGTVQEDTVPSAGVGSTEAALKADIGAIAESALNGIGTGPAEESGRKDEQRQNRPPNGREEEEEAGAHLEGIPDAGGRLEDQVSNTLSQENGVSPPPPSRRITRALAANKNPASHSNAPTPPLSPASSSTNDSSSSHLQIHPLYLVSPSANPSNSAIAFHGLLPEEALETRRLLALYIQKQEESVRGYEAILSKLLTAQRLRSEVLEMCKTEEHVGELSDGEDWIDAEKWGLQAGELRKGRDEDEDAMEENNFGGRKGKRRGRN